MTEADFMRRLRADAEKQLQVCETATKLLPEDLLYTTLERRAALRSMIKQYDEALSKLE